MRTKLSIVLAILLTVTSGWSVRAADTPLSVFPKDTGVLMRLKAPQKTLKKTGDLAVQVDREVGTWVQFSMPGFGLAISNPELKGVDLNGDWWVGIFPEATGEPGIVFCIPATDAEQMRKSITGDYMFQAFEKWVIYTEHEATAAAIKKQLSAKGESISGMMDERAMSVWEAGDLSVFINVPRLLKVYEGAFDQGVQKVYDFLDQLPNFAPPQQGVNMDAIVELYAGIFKQLVQGVKDAQGCTGAVIVGNDGLSIHETVTFAADSKTLKSLAKHQPTALETLGQLPANRTMYGAAELDISALMKWGMRYSLGMFAEGDTEKENQMKELIAKYEKIDFQSMAMAFGFGNVKEGAMRMATILNVDQPEKVRELSKESSKLMSNYNVGGVKMKMTFEPESETYGDVKADIAKIKYEINPQNPGAEMQKKINDTLYGLDGMITRTLYLKDRMAQTMGGGKPAAQELLDAINGKNSVGSQAAFQATRKQLLPKANLIGMIDLPGTIAGGIELARQSDAPIPITENELKDIRGESSFAGFSLAVQPTGLEAKTAIPVEQMQGIARLVRTIQEHERARRQ